MVFSSIATTEQATWQWQSTPHLFLQCRLLEEFPHGFFTRHFVNYSLSELTQVLSPTAIPYRSQQVHGNRIITPSEMAEEATSYASADGLLSEGEQQALWVASADCTPVLIADVNTKQVAAVHAGWRGTAQSILPGAIARLLANGSQLSDLRVALGPAISGQVYQVAEEVAVEVGATLFPQHTNISPAGILEKLWEMPSSPLFPDSEPGKVRLDVRCVNSLQLEQIGFHPEQIAVAPHCTYQETEHFFSYRRHQERAIQWSGIVKPV